MSLDNLPVQSQERAPHPLRMMRYTAQLVIATSTLFGVNSVLSEPAQAQERKQLSEEQKEKIKAQVRKELSTAPVAQLLQWMNSIIYDVREMSTKELLKRSTQVFEETGKFPEEIQQFIDNKRDFPPEVRHRLGLLSHKFAELEQVRMLSGSNVKFPKKEMAVRDWLACISKQIERPVNFYGEVKLNDEIIQTKDGMFWDVIADARLKDGQQFIYYSASPVEVNLHIGKRDGRLTATDGAVSAQLDTEIGTFRSMVEPKVDMQTFRIIAIRQRDEKGVMHNADPSRATHASIPIFVPAHKPFYAEIDIEVRAFRMRKFDVEDPKKPQSIQAGEYSYQYKGLDPQTNSLGQYEATLEPEEQCPRSFNKRVKCSVSSKSGENYNVGSMTQTESSTTWNFGKTPPEKISLHIPLDKPDDEGPVRKVTLVFKRD